MFRKLLLVAAVLGVAWWAGAGKLLGLSPAREAPALTSAAWILPAGVDAAPSAPGWKLLVFFSPS